MSFGNRGAATDTGTWEDCLCVSMGSWPTGIFVAGISPARRFSTNTPSLASFSPAALTAFGERLDNEDDSSSAIRSLGEGWFTGKPHVAGLGHAFLFRNYRATLAKWQTADPLGYPDGWNQLSYCGNAEDWYLEYGPRHTGITIDYNSDVTNAGLGALIIDGCIHHWEAKLVKE